ncbi:MAG TPA: OsmC family protein [Tepidisphaeraceae bacterium]|jgi:putative redox protein
MVEMQIVYEGKLRCNAKHVDSGAKLLTDAPKDNMGNGESFSPTDLVATALATCMLTTMGIAAQRMEIDITGSRVVVTKEMAATPFRHISRLNSIIHVPTQVTAEQRQKLETAAMTCPVKKSLHPDIQAPVEFKWG